MKICLGANLLFYSGGGGHAWAYLNWALAFRSVGCEVLWLESAREHESPELVSTVERLRRVLAPYGFDDALILDTAGQFPAACAAMPLEAALDVDLFVDLAYAAPEVVAAFPRTVLVDYDPGFTQLWWSRGELAVGAYDAYFTVGAGVASGRARVPDCGVRWRYTPPCVDLSAWPEPSAPPADGAWTTVSHWWGEWEELSGEEIDTSKRAGFEPLLDLPARTGVTLELALGGLEDEEERERLERHGWRVRDSDAVASGSQGYRSYVQASRGEFSAAKPLYVATRSGWLSERTVCYLASARPALVQDTGAGDCRGEGLLTFTDAEDAAAKLALAERDYERHCRAARRLAEEQFSGTVVAARLLEASP